MRGTKVGLFAVLAVFALTACPKQQDPFFVAKTTIAGARAAITLTDVGFAKAAQVKSAQCADSICIKVDPDKGDRYKACMLEDQGTKPEYQTCYKGMKEATAAWEKGKVVGVATCNAADDAVKLAQKIYIAKQSGNPEALAKACSEVDPTKGAAYEACLKGDPVGLLDWLAIIKSGLCVAAKALAFVPAAYDVYTKPVVALFESYGCKK